MKNLNKLLLISLCITALTNCSSVREKDFVSLPDKLQNEVKSTDAYVQETANVMHADIESSNITTYTGGGLLFAFVDMAVMSHREDKAKEAMGCVQKELDSFNVHQKVQEKFAHSLKYAKWMNVSAINYLKQIDEKTKEELIKNGKGDAILLTNFSYKLNPQMDVLTGTIYLAQYPTSERLKSLVKIEDPYKTPIFKVNISATETLPQKGENIEENARLWAQNNGDLLKKSLERIIERTFRDLNVALENPTHVIGE